MGNDEICVVREEDIPENEKYLYGHLVKYKGEEWIRLRPSYWLYNAGIVGVIRAIEEMRGIVEEWEKEGKIGKETLKELSNNIEELERKKNKLKEKIERKKSELKDKKEVYLNVAIYLSYRKWCTELNSDEINEDYLLKEIEKLKEVSDCDKNSINKIIEIVMRTNIGFKKGRGKEEQRNNCKYTFKEIEFIKNEKMKKNNKEKTLKKDIENILLKDKEEIKNLERNLEKVIEQIEKKKMDRKILLLYTLKEGNAYEYSKCYKFVSGDLLIKKELWDVLPEIYVNVMDNFFTDEKKWYNKFFHHENGWFATRMQLREIRNISTMYENNHESVNKYISYKIKINTISLDNIGLEVNCSFCGGKVNINNYFDRAKFSLEGGSYNKFSNFYRSEDTGIYLCNICDLVLYFIPISIYKEKFFVNVNDVELLWKLNKYMWNIDEVEKEKHENKEKNRLVDAIVSVGNILSLKAKWTLQNIELIEIGGARNETVYAFQIGETASALLSSFKNRKIVEWLNSGKLINFNKVYTIRKSNKGSQPLKGFQVINAFIKDNNALLLKYSLLMFSIITEYYSHEKKEKYYFQEKKDPKKYTMGNLKEIIKWTQALVNLTISLYEKDIYDETYYWFGKRFYYVIKDKEVKNVISYYFSLIRKLDKNTLVNEIVKEYVRENKEVDKQLLNLLDTKNEKFQIYALSFLSGIVDRLSNQNEN